MEAQLLIPASTAQRERLFTWALTARATSSEIISCSIDVQARTLRVRQEAAEARISSLRARIVRRLIVGRLPYHSAPIIHGAPGADGRCGVCDRPLTPRQLVMSVPFKQAFVYLHADCFVLWDDERRKAARAVNRVA